MTAETVSISQFLEIARTELTVMTQRSELDVKDTSLILTHTANANCVATTKVAVEAGLRTVRLVVAKDLDGGLRC